MFLEYYGLLEQPFGAASGPAHVYASRTHCEVLDSSRRSILGDRGSFALIAGPGMGKTTLLYQLIEDLRQTGRATFLFQSQCNSADILRFLLSAMQVDSAGMELAAMHSKLNEIWFAEMLAGKRFVLTFDDAEDLDDAVLETLRQLLKCETSNTKLLQIVLCGQPKLLKKLEQESQAQLRKRIVEVQHLETLSPMETAGYIRQRLEAAGHLGKSLFDPEAMAVVGELSQGIPKNINKICSRALLEAYARGLHSVSANIVEKAGRNLSAMATADAPQPLPSTEVAGTHAREVPGRRVPSQLTYRTPAPFGLPGSGVWAGAIVGVLLSAGLALPHGMFKGVTHIMRGAETAATSQAQREQTSQPLSNPERPATGAAVQPAIAPKSTLDAADTSNHGMPDALPEPRTSQTSRLSLTRELGLKINRIVIDPGHGGFDTGAKGPHGLLEKDLCLDVALRLGKMIEDNIAGAEVVYTRKDDSYVPLEERTAIANGADADLFISIHANSSDISEVRGVETYYLSLAASKEAKELAIRENALSQSSLHDLPDLVKKITRNERIAESKLLAVEIQDTLSTRLQVVSGREKNRGVKQAPFIVLTGANMPAVLSEISFVSNASDESLLLGSGQRQRIADGLYRGIAAYLDGLNGIPQNKQKLVTENRGGALSGFDRSMVEARRNPLYSSESVNSSFRAESAK
jgi:N-acetylmuramoyl-L-alanine amidase